MKKCIFLFCIIFILAGCSQEKQSYTDIKFVVPAGTNNEPIFSAEEICPLSDEITLTALDGFENIEASVNLSAINALVDYVPSSFTEGSSVKRNVLKGACYKLSLSLDNPTDKDITLIVRAEPVAGITRSE